MLLLVACGSTPEPTATPVPAEPTQPPPEPTEEPAATEPTEPPEAEVLFPAEMASVARGKEIYAANCAVLVVKPPNFVSPVVL